MAKTDVGHDAITPKLGSGIIEPIIKNDKPTPANPRKSRTRTPKPAPTIPPAKTDPITETPFVLKEETSTVARDNVDIRLKAANVESLPDENILVAGAAGLLLMLLDGIGMLTFGDFAKLSNIERAMIGEPLQHILSKISPASLAMIGKYSDPALLLMGMFAWISRVTSESKRRQAAAAKPVTPEPAPKVVEPVEAGKENPMDMNPPMDIISNFRAESNIVL